MVQAGNIKDVVKLWGKTNAEESNMLRPMIKLRIAEYEAQKDKKIDRKELAEYLNLSVTHLSGVITGAQQTTPERLFKLAKVLDCKVDDLYLLEDK